MERLEERRMLATDIRLIGITGNLQSNAPGFGNDEVLYDIKYGLPGTNDPAFMDGFVDGPNAPDTKLTISNTVGVTEGFGSLRVEVDNNVGAYWGINSGNVADLLKAGATTLSYDMTLTGIELNGGAFGGGTDNSFNGYAQNNKLAVSLNTQSHGFFQRDFNPAVDGDSLGTNATWSGINGTRTITWLMGTLTNDQGTTLADFVTANNFTDARIWLVTQGADTNGNVGPMRFYFDNFQTSGAPGTTKIADFELLQINKILQLPHVPDTDAIAFNPETGLLHRVSGSKSYRNNPLRIGYRDDQFMETIDMNDPVNGQVGIFNANYEGGPETDPSNGNIINYGLPAPFPTWVSPDHRRTDEETDPSFANNGPNEYNAARDLTWSNSEHLFFVSDEDGLYKLTPDGIATFFVYPAGPSQIVHEPKGLTFYTNSAGQRVLMLAERDGPNLFMLDPATGQAANEPVVMLNENGFPVPGMLSLVEDPTSNTLLGIAKVVGDSGNAENRLLVRIDTVTGQTTPIGNFGTYMADLAFIVPPPAVKSSEFVYENAPQRLVFSFTQNVGSSITAADLEVVKLGPGGGPVAVGEPTYDIYNNTVTFPFLGLLSDGNYRATLKADGVTNSLDMPITANEEVAFFWLNGDLNRDRTVSISDFIDLASRFNQPATKWSEGDLNYDGQISISDFIDLSANFNKTIDPPAPAPAAASETLVVQSPDSDTLDSEADSSVIASNEVTLFSTAKKHKKTSHHRRPAHKAKPAKRWLSRANAY